MDGGTGMSNDIDNGDYAFPSGDGEYGGGPNHCYGMTLRDWFAGQALAGLSVEEATVIQMRNEPLEEAQKRFWARAATAAYMAADAMLAQRKKDRQS